MPVKLTIKAKDFICIYTSGADQLCSQLPPSAAARARTRSPAAQLQLPRAGGGGAGGALRSTCKGGTAALRSPHLPGLLKSREEQEKEKALPESSGFKQSGVWL